MYADERSTCTHTHARCQLKRQQMAQQQNKMINTHTHLHKLIYFHINHIYIKLNKRKQSKGNERSTEGKRVNEIKNPKSRDTKKKSKQKPTKIYMNEKKQTNKKGKQKQTFNMLLK